MRIVFKVSEAVECTARVLWRLCLVLSVGLGLASCAVAPLSEEQARARGDAALAACCRDMERYPRWAVAALETQIDKLGPGIGGVVLRPARLQGSAAVRTLMRDSLQPLDIVTVSNKGRASGQLLPGFFSHAAIYIGTEPQLRAQGLWDTAALRPHHAAIRAGGIFFDATKRGVGFTTLEEVSTTDAFAILRPRMNSGERHRLMVALMARAGDPFDYHFNAGDPRDLYCVELIDLTYPGIDLPHHRAFGREVVVPDDLAAQALRGHPRLHLVGYVFRRAGQIMTGTPQMLAATIGTQWPDP